MTWNYRIVRKKGTYGIHEVYYNDLGAPSLVSVESMTLGMFETIEELKGDLELINNALSKPVLNYEDIGNHSPKT